jgi:ornithine carbamoyltransferase
VKVSILGMGRVGSGLGYLLAGQKNIKELVFIDEIRATMRFGDILMYRPLKHKSLVEAKKVAKIPIINALSEKYHPCQGLGDVLTMVEKSGGTLENFRGKKVVYLGIANNVSNSLVMATTKLGAKITLCIAEKNSASFDKELENEAKKTGLYEETKDLSCLKDADFVYTDTWIVMEFFDKDGNVKEDFKEEFERRKKVFNPFHLKPIIYFLFC